MPQRFSGRDGDARTSYVIGTNGKIAMVHDDLDFSKHVEKTLAAVKALK